MTGKRELIVNAITSPNTSSIVTEVLLKVLDNHKEELLKIIKEDKLKINPLNVGIFTQ
ncbi:hypothetical protein [Clostridium culturomicium]|uniref:hypothetical protein n=1 Tax=Clostridium culturomicium TaxID=1499683 RepID=UPI0038573176